MREGLILAIGVVAGFVMCWVQIYIGDYVLERKLKAAVRKNPHRQVLRKIL